MNQDKAREFFSAYHEGVLEPGLKLSFERQLSSDPNLKADFIAFGETIVQLDELRHEEIEIPIFLSDRIASRLEQVQAKPKFGFPIWTSWVRGAAFAGLAIVAIVGALPLLHGKSNVSTGSLVGSSTLDQITFKVDGSNVVLNFEPSSAKTLVVSSPTTGKEIQRFNLDGQRLQSPIQNSLANPAIFKIEVIGDKNSALIVVPGTQVPKAKAGEGSIQDLALALSGRYKVAVAIEAADVTHHVTWNFSSPDARSAAHQAVASEGFSVDQRSDGLIEILDR